MGGYFYRAQSKTNQLHDKASLLSNPTRKVKNWLKIKDHRHLSLKVQYVEFDINVPLRQQYIENLMSKIYDVELLICRLL